MPSLPIETPQQRRAKRLGRTRIVTAGGGANGDRGLKATVTPSPLLARPKPAPQFVTPEEEQRRSRETRLADPSSYLYGQRLQSQGGRIPDVPRSIGVGQTGGNLLAGYQAITEEVASGVGQLNPAQRKRAAELERQGVSRANAIVQAYRETDLPSASVPVSPVRIPLPGGRSFKNVSVGVKGALEMVTDPTNLLPGGLIADAARPLARAAAKGATDVARKGTIEAATRLKPATVAYAAGEGLPADVRAVRELLRTHPDPTPAQIRALFPERAHQITNTDADALVQAARAVEVPRGQQTAGDAAKQPWEQLSHYERGEVAGLDAKIGAHPEFPALRSAIERAWVKAQGKSSRYRPVSLADYLTTSIAKQPEVAALQNKIAKAVGVRIQRSSTSLYGSRYLDIPEPRGWSSAATKHVEASAASVEVPRGQQAKVAQGVPAAEPGAGAVPPVRGGPAVAPSGPAGAAPQPPAAAPVPSGARQLSAGAGPAPTAGGGALPPSPASPPAVPPREPPAYASSGKPDDVLKQLTAFIHSPDSLDLATLTKEMRRTQQGQRINAFQETLTARLAEGVPFDAALNEAKGALAGAYDRPNIALVKSMVKDWREAGLARINEVLKDEPWELLSTAQAFENAMKGQAIPRDLGVAGGSAYTRLSRVFPQAIMDILNARKPVSRLFEERLLKAGPPTGPSRTIDYPVPQLTGEQLGMGIGGRAAQGQPIDTAAFRAWTDEMARTKAQGDAAFREWVSTHPVPDIGPLGAPQQGALLPNQPMSKNFAEGFAAYVVRLEQARKQGADALSQWIRDHPLPDLGALGGETKASKTGWQSMGEGERQYALGRQQGELIPSPTSTIRDVTPPSGSVDQLRLDLSAPPRGVGGQPPGPPTAKGQQPDLIPPTPEQQVARTLHAAGVNVWDILGVVRAIKSSGDISAPFRQGIMLTGQPKEFSSAFKEMFSALKSPEGQARIQAEITSSPYYALAERSGLDLTATGPFVRLVQREEAYATKLAQHIPGVAMSERAYVGFLNAIRAKTFYSYVEHFGEASATPKDWQNLARFINYASGRGTLGPAQKYAGELATGLFSPRFLASRFQVWTMLAADNPFKSGMSVSRIAAKNLSVYIGLNVALLSLLKASGASVNLDPRSSDFGDAKIGNTRVNFFAGMSEIATLFARLMTGQSVTSATGRPYEQSRSTTALRFGRTKLAPVPGTGVTLGMGKTIGGDELRWDGKSIVTVTGDFIAPMAPMDIYEAVREHGPLGAAFAPASLTGGSVSTYQTYATAADIAAARKAVAKQLFPWQPFNKLTEKQNLLVNMSPEVAEARAKQRPSGARTAAPTPPATPTPTRAPTRAPLPGGRGNRLGRTRIGAGR